MHVCVCVEMNMYSATKLATDEGMLQLFLTYTHLSLSLYVFVSVCRLESKVICTDNNK